MLSNLTAADAEGKNGVGSIANPICNIVDFRQFCQESTDNRF